MTKTDLSGWRAAHSITFCRRRAASKPGRGSPSCRGTLPPDLRSRCWWMSGRLDHQTHGGEHGTVLAKGPLSTGAIGRFLVPEPLPKRLLYVERLRLRRRMRVRFGGSGSPIARMSSCSSSRARRWFRTAQIATSTSARWSMSPVACPRRLRAARKHFRSPSKWSGTWRDCCR